MGVKNPTANDMAMVEYFRREYLEAKQKIPRKPFIYPLDFEEEAWKKRKKLYDFYDKASRKGKLPEQLPESIYKNLEDRIRIYLDAWSVLRRANDPEVGEQARKRIRKAFEALYFRQDRREKINLLTLWNEYYLEKMMVENVLKKLRNVATPNGRIWDRDKRNIGLSWDLTAKEVEEIWKNRKQWRSFVRERLAKRHGVSIERLNKLKPISQKACTTFIKHDPIGKGLGSLAESLIELDRFKKLLGSGS